MAEHECWPPPVEGPGVSWQCPDCKRFWVSVEDQDGDEYPDWLEV